MNTTHTHTVHCETKTVTTVRDGITTHSAEFACEGERAAKFDAILDADRDVRLTALKAGAGVFSWDRERGADQWIAAKARRADLIAELAADELIAFNEYRQQ